MHPACQTKGRRVLNRITLAPHLNGSSAAPRPPSFTCDSPKLLLVQAELWAQDLPADERSAGLGAVAMLRSLFARHPDATSTRLEVR